MTTIRTAKPAVSDGTEIIGQVSWESDGEIGTQIIATLAATLFEQAGDGKLAGGVWWQILESQKRLAETDPVTAIDLGLFLISVDDSQLQDLPETIAWLESLRGNGIQLLLQPEVQQELAAKLRAQNPQAPQVLHHIEGLMKRPVDLTIVTTIKDLGEHPEAFTLLTSVVFVEELMGWGLGSALGGLPEQARATLSTPDFQRILALYTQISDTRELVAKLSQAPNLTKAGNLSYRAYYYGIPTPTGRINSYVDTSRLTHVFGREAGVATATYIDKRSNNPHHAVLNDLEAKMQAASINPEVFYTQQGYCRTEEL